MCVCVNTCNKYLVSKNNSYNASLFSISDTKTFSIQLNNPFIIDHFRVPKTVTFKVSLGAQPFL